MARTGHDTRARRSGFAGVTVPPYPTIGAYPRWFTANDSVSNIDRAAGSDTTFYMMQQLSDEYNQAGLYGCTLVGSGTGQNAFCDHTTGGAPNYSDTTTTDTTDNFDSSEELMGENDIGSGNGQQQLCGILPSPQTVDFSRSSKPIASNAGCSTLAESGYAKDSVPVTDVQGIDPAAVRCRDRVRGQDLHRSEPDVHPPGVPVERPHRAGGGGLVPGDPTNCVAQGSGGSGPFCSGTPFNDVDGGTGTGASSVAYRLWCATDSTRITDWGQLTNLSAANNGGTAQTVGNGTPIGVPIRIIGVNKGSGTVATFNAFANSGVTGGGCSASPFNPNAASGQNPLSNDGYTGNLEIALENNASQIGDFAAANWPNDPADQAVDIATSLYFEGYGYYNTIPNAGTVPIEPGTGTIPTGVPGAYVVSLTNENGIVPSIANERSNNYPTARTLFNIWNTGQDPGVRGRVPQLDLRHQPGRSGGRVCDQGEGPALRRELRPRHHQHDPAVRVHPAHRHHPRVDCRPSSTPADGLVTPNATCSANLSITSTGTATVTDNAGTVPSSVAVGWTVTGRRRGRGAVGHHGVSVSGSTAYPLERDSILGHHHLLPWASARLVGDRPQQLRQDRLTCDHASSGEGEVPPARGSASQVAGPRAEGRKRTGVRTSTVSTRAHEEARTDDHDPDQRQAAQSPASDSSERRPRRGIAVAAQVVGGALFVAGIVLAFVPSDAEAATLTAGPVTLTPGSPYHSGQTIDITVAANATLAVANRATAGFPSGAVAIKVVECADPGGLAANLPKKPSQCDYNTVDSVPGAEADGSLIMKGYTMYALPDAIVFGEPSDQTPACGTWSRPMRARDLHESQRLHQAPHLLGAVRRDARTPRRRTPS